MHIPNYKLNSIIDRTYKAFKDTHRKKSHSTKIPAFTKSTNMDIWVVGTSN